MAKGIDLRLAAIVSTSISSLLDICGCIIRGQGKGTIQPLNSKRIRSR